MPKTTDKHKLINLETHYQKLQYRLETYSSERLKLEHLRLFLYELARNKHNSIYFSYFEELIQEYTQLITPNNLEYRSIEVLESLQFIGTTFIDQKIKEAQSAEFLNTQAIISTQISLTYIYLGEWYKGLRVFFPTLKHIDFNNTNSDITLDLSNSSEHATLREYIQVIGKDTLKNNQTIKTILYTLKNWEDTSTSTQTNKIWVLLVEHESQKVFGDNKNDKDVVVLGNIQQLNTNVHILASNSAHDFVLFNNLSLSYNDLLYQQANTATTVAKKSLGQTLSKSNNKYNVEYSFLKKDAYYSGESLGLAMTLSTISNISKNRDYKNKYSLLQNYCITGSISNDGSVNSISKKALTIKLSAVFYSPFKKVLVPQGNKKQTIEQLKQLKEKYPHRNLEIIAVRTITDAIVNQKIVLNNKISFIQRLKLKIKYLYITIISILAALLVFHFIFPTNIDQNPVKLKIGNSKIEVYNISDKRLWDYDFGYILDIPLYGNASYNDLPLYFFDDINNDGTNELVIGPQAQDRTISGSIQVFSSSGELIWSYDQHPVMTFGDEIFNDIYAVTAVRINTFLGEKIIFVSFAKYIWYPSRLVAFDLKGNILGKYWNSGIAHVMQFIDIDDDGIDEIFLGGCNNDYNTAIMAILEHDCIDGHSPQIKKAYIPKGIAKGTEKYYIKFPDPRSALLDARRGAIQKIELVGNKLLIREIIGTEDQHRAFYTLNKNLEVNSFDINDAYIAYYNRLTGRDFLIDYPKLKLKEMFYALEFWNGEKFVSEPAMSNQNWDE